METDKHLYTRAKEDARYITEITTQLEFLAMLEGQGVIKEGTVDSSYEAKRKRDIKNALANIYLVLNLHEVKGIADYIFNADYKPEE